MSGRATNPRAEEATHAIAEVLRSLGLSSNSSLEVLRSENNVVLAVDETVVAKAVEQPNSEALCHEAAVIEALVGSNAPVVRPSRLGLGPFTTDGWTVILLEKMTELPLNTSSIELTKSLAEIHTALSTVSIELPKWTTHMERTAHIWKHQPFTDRDQEIAERAYERFVQPSFEYAGPVQPIHGDAWSGQAICTPDGLRWIDFESTCVGPREWDLAGFDDPSGYGDFDDQLWQQLKLVKSWSVAVWCNVHQAHSPDLAIHVEHHLHRLADELRIDDGRQFNGLC